MKSLVPWRFGVVAALTVAAGYAVCTLVWFALMGPSMAFLNSLFHGLDFRTLYIGGSFEPVASLATATSSSDSSPSTTMERSRRRRR